MMDNTPPRRLLATSMYAMVEAEEQNRRAAQRLRMLEQQERAAELEAEHLRRWNRNMDLAMEVLRASRLPLRWTQIVHQLDSRALEGVRAQLKGHPNISHTKRGKHTYMEWKE